MNFGEMELEKKKYLEQAMEAFCSEADFKIEEVELTEGGYHAENQVTYTLSNMWTEDKHFHLEFEFDAEGLHFIYAEEQAEKIYCHKDSEGVFTSDEEMLLWRELFYQSNGIH